MRIKANIWPFVNVCSVVGSALTFRIRQNSLNLSAEDVANKAGEWQAFSLGPLNLHPAGWGKGQREFDERGKEWAGTYWLIHKHVLSLYCSSWEEVPRGRDRFENHPDWSGRGKNVLQPQTAKIHCDQPIYRLVIMGTGWYNEALSLVSQQQNWPHRSLFST